jgi:hypothetical protein
MLNTIAQAHGLLTEVDLADALVAYETDLSRELGPLEAQLSRNVITGAPGDIMQHMGYVETWRDRVTRFLMVAAACVEHAKSDNFEAVSDKKMTEERRKSYQRRLAGGWDALYGRLEQLIKSIDSRVNLCKKVLGIDSETGALGTYRRAV